MRLAVIVGVLGLPLAAVAEGTRQVKVLLEFRQTGTTEHEDLPGRGSVIIYGDDVRSRGGLSATSTTTRTRRSTGIFTIVQDGGSSMLSVNTRIPYQDVAYFRDYATGAGYASSGVSFENVGSALRVNASVLEGERIRVRLTPTISYFAADGSGAIDFTEAATELVVRAGEPVIIGGATSETNDLTRRILGLGSESGRSETTLVLTASFL